jgi:hypothetical protein
MPVDVTKVVDNVGQLMDRVAQLTYSDVLVGIPAERSGRRDRGPTNAELGRIHEFGSPAHNIPARPFLYPGGKKIQKQALAMMKQAAIDALQGTGAPVDETLNRVGMLARDSVVESITNPVPPFEPLKPATIRARLRRTAGGRRKLRDIKEGGQAVGMSMSTALLAYAGSNWDSGGAGLNVKPLIDTGQLRASITYVVRKAAL